MTLILSLDDVKSVLAMGPCIDAVEEAFRQYSLGNVVQPTRPTIRIAEHRALINAMPAYIGGVEALEYDDILDIMQCRTPQTRAEEGNVIEVVPARSVRVNFAKLTRHVFSATSCGLCGKATIASVAQQFPPLRRPWRASAALLRALPARLAVEQPVFRATGGLHAAALFDPAGALLVAREDVGRHNAVDKVLGHALRSGWLPLRRHILMVSGRVSFEVMQKALAACVPVIAGVSAPTSLAAEFARANGQTLVGFLRADRLNVYAGRLAAKGG